MELRQLHYFVTIVNEGNISQAAKRLHISQPPLSHQMKLLEEELGVTLFERGSRRIRLTLPGKALYEKALAILDLSALAKTEIINVNHEILGVIKLGVISSAAEFVTSRFLSPFRAVYARGTFEGFESNYYHLLGMLQMYKKDMAVIRTPFSHTGLDCRSLPPEPFIAAARAPFLLENGDPALALSSLSSQPLIIYRRWAQVILNYFDELALSPHIVCTTDDARTAILWARENLGIAVIPQSALYLTQDPELIQKKISAPSLNSSICLARRQEKFLSLAASAFYETFSL